MSRAAEIYRDSRKAKDIFWNRYVARPAAAVLLVGLERTRVTPNQITLGSLAVFVAAAVVIGASPSHGGLVAGVCILQFSYVLDCADGQLARLRGTSTPVGAHLDFLMDELKAFLLVAAIGIRLWRQSSETGWLVEGLLALAAVASAISLTTFVRRPEYIAATGVAPPVSTGDYGAGGPSPPPSRSVPLPIRAIEGLGRFVIHYPSHILYVAIFNRLDIFLHAYLAINAAYAARSLLGISRRLGKPLA